MNVTKNVEKWQLDEHGKRMIFQGRNREQKAISYEEHHPETVEEMMANGIHAVPLTEGGFDEYVQSHPYAFINFYAPWCIWCCLGVVSRRPVVWRRLHFIQMRRLRERRSGVVSFSSLRPFGRDARPARRCQRLEPTWEAMAEEVDASDDLEAVSYTHLTLPTKRIV